MMKSITLNSNDIKNFQKMTKNLRHEQPHQYEKIRIKDKDIILILYNSGKLVYEDNKSTLSFLVDFLNDKRNSYNNNRKNNKKNNKGNNHKRRNKSKKNNYKHKKNWSNNKWSNNKNYHQNNQISISNYEYTIGSDETGKGEWYGPLVITAVSTSYVENFKLKEIGVKDSKKLSKKDIRKLYKKIEELNIKHETLILKPFSYNKLYDKFKKEGKNLNHLLAYLHSKAINDLLKQTKSTNLLIIIDKFDYKKMNQYLDVNDKITVVQENNGERYIPVATSSIIAKYHYEKTLKELEEKYNIKLDKMKTKPWTIDKNIIDKVAKTHFKNIKPYT